MRRRLKQVTPYLTDLLQSKDYIYSNIKFQDRDGYVNTCGSHVVHRLYRLKNDGMDLQTYYNYMKDIKDSIGVNYDIIVAEF
ncbi:MAG: hypothetical protein ACKPKO_53490, partial [Candidatus Fonsibacter sp.]